MDGVTLDELVNRFLAAKQHALDIGQIGLRQYNDLKRDGARLLDILGRRRPVASLRGEDFALLRARLANGRNATTVTNIVIRVRSIFRWGFQTARLLASPVEYGGEFCLPPAKARRRALRDNRAGGRFLAAEDIRALLVAAESHPNLLAMTLLGVNAALGNTDCAELRFGHLRLSNDPPMLDFPRVKTETDRRAVLWAETVEALRNVLAARAAMTGIPADLVDRVFITSHRRAYVRFNAAGTAHIDSISPQFAKLLRRSLNQPRPK